MTNKYDKLLIDGLSKLKELEFSNIPEADEIDYTFSDGYIKNKDKLLNKLGHSYWKFVNTVAKKAAVIIFALIISFSSLMTVDAFREKVLDFAYKIYYTFTQLEANYKNGATFIKTNYCASSISNSFGNYTANLSEAANTYSWSDNKNRLILLTQSLKHNLHQFNSEHGELSEKIINDTPCLICKDSNLYYCYWEFDGYRFELIYPIDLGEEFMSEVVGNLVEIDPEELEN